MSANETQVGGAHYKSQYQHWDFVVDTGLDYFGGQVTKYVTRHKLKNGRQDLEKALHFAQKWQEVLSRKGPNLRPGGPMAITLHERLRRYFHAQPHLGPGEQAVISKAVFVVSANDAYILVSGIEELLKCA